MARPVLTEFQDDLEEHLQGWGDDIADVLEQMIKGNWKDDHGHPVNQNVAMIALKDGLKEMVEFRAKWLGYENTLER